MSKTRLPDGMRVRWLGHATFDLVGPAGQKFLFDPFLVENPAFPKNLGAEVTAFGAYDTLLITHAHADHFSDVVPLLKDDPALKAIAPFEIGEWLQARHDIKDSRVMAMNPGGTLTFKDVRITMVPAAHSSSIAEGRGNERALGCPVGYVLRFANGFTIYNTGDTSATMDMKIVHDLYKPNLVILPIGDVYTMGPEQAAYALHLLQPQLALGGHYHTWGEMPPGTPAELEKELARYKLSTQIITLKPGETLT